MTNKEVIDRVQHAYSKGVPSDDSRLRARYIYSKLLTARARILEQDSNKKQQINEVAYQPLHCIELISVPSHECPCLPPAGCEILRTKYKIPSPLSNHNTHLLRDVTSIDGSINYNEESWKSTSYKKGNKYTSQKLDYYLRSDYVYVTHKSGPKLITVNGVFNNPIEADTYPTYCKEYECDDCVSYLDLEFPLDNSNIEIVIDICVNTLLAPFMSAQEDITNNSRDTREDQAK